MACTSRSVMSAPRVLEFVRSSVPLKTQRDPTPRQKSRFRHPSLPSWGVSQRRPPFGDKIDPLHPVLPSAPVDSPHSCRQLVLPELLEPARGQLGVADGMRNIAVAQILLDRTGVVTFVGQLEPTGM